MNKTVPFLYQRVKNSLIDMIHEERLSPGDKLPSERELARRLGCNYQTVRRGFALLQEENMVERRVGAGTFLLSSEPQTQTSEPTTWNAKTGRNERSHRTIPVVGVIAMSDMSEFDREFLHHLHQQVHARNCRLMIQTISDSQTYFEDAIREFVDQGSTAILLPRIPFTIPSSQLLEIFTKTPIPVVLSHPVPGLENYYCRESANSGQPTLMAVETACRYFRELGYGHIAYLGGNCPAEQDLQRQVMTYCCFVAREGLQTILGLPVETGPGCPSSEQVDRLVQQWSAMAGDLAVICWGDEYAMRLMVAIHKQGLRIPEDIAVLGFGDIPMARKFDPPLSTIRFDYDYVANTMLDQMEAMKQGRFAQATGVARQILVARDSCGGKLRAGEKLPEIIERAQRNFDPVAEP